MCCVNFNFCVCACCMFVKYKIAIKILSVKTEKRVFFHFVDILFYRSLTVKWYSHVRRHIIYAVTFILFFRLAVCRLKTATCTPRKSLPCRCTYWKQWKNSKSDTGHTRVLGSELEYIPVNVYEYYFTCIGIFRSFF